MSVKKINVGNWWIESNTQFYLSLFLGSSISRAPSGTKRHWGFVDTLYNLFPKGNSFLKRWEIVVILLKDRNQGFWSHLGLSWWNVSDYFQLPKYLLGCTPENSNKLIKAPLCYAWFLPVFCAWSTSAGSHPEQWLEIKRVLFQVISFTC